MTRLVPGILFERSAGMIRCLTAVLALVLVVAPAGAAGIKGQYIEARTCDVWTGPCFANAEVNLTGKHAILGWKVDQGSLDGVALDGLGVVAIVAASDTLGIAQTGPAKAVLLVDKKATSAQRGALVKLAKQQGGELTRNVIAVRDTAVSFERCECKNDACVVLEAGPARIETKCLDAKHKVCGNESEFFPPLTQNVKVKAALAEDCRFTAYDLTETWKESGRRSAYIGSFEIR
jgi:hypothetical protein